MVHTVTDGPGIEHTDGTIDPDVRTLLADAGQAFAQDSIVVLPERVQDGVGFYNDEQVATVKELRAAGVAASYLQTDPKKRTYASEYSAGFVYDMAIAVLGNLTYDTAVATVRYLLAKASLGNASAHDPVRMSLSIARLSRDGLEVEGLHMDGIPDELGDPLLKYLMGSSDPTTGA